MRLQSSLIIFLLFINQIALSSENNFPVHSKSKILLWLDSASADLNQSNLPFYVDFIEHSLDSLNKEQSIKYLKKAWKYTETVNTINLKAHYLLAEEYYSILDYDSTIYHADKLTKNFAQAEPKQLALALEIYASSLLRTENYTAIERLLSAHGDFLKQKFPNNYLFVFNALLHSYMIQSDYDQVIIKSQEAVDFALKKENYRVAISLQNKIAAAHKNNKNFDIARKYLLNNLDILKDHPDSTSETYVNYDLGLFYRELNDLDSAIIFMRKAISLMSPQNKNTYSTQLATFYADNGQFKEATEVLDAIDFKLLIDHTAKGEYYYGRGMTYAGLGKYKNAFEALDSALVLRAGAPREVARLKNAISKLKQQTGAPDEALELYKQADIIEDSLFSIEKQKVIAKLETQHQLATKEKEIFELEANAARNRLLLIGAIGLAILLLIIALLFIRSYKLKRKANEQLFIKNQHLKTLREKEKQLAETTIHAKERELATMAMAAHEKNTLLQDLEQKVGFLEKKLNNDLSPDFKDLKKTIANSFSIDNSWENFHNHFQDVHPLFFEKLRQINPDLSIDDLKLSAYLKIGMSNKEIASVIHLTVGSVKTKVNRLKKKLEMGPQENLRNFMFHNN